jgi:hypothetical protein
MNRLENDWPTYALLIIVLVVMITISRLPWEKWAVRKIENWAKFKGLRIADIEWGPFGPYDRFFRKVDSLEHVYRVWLVDELGQQSQIIAIVSPLFRRIRVEPIERK